MNDYTIIFIHGFFSSPKSRKFSYFKEYLDLNDLNHYNLIAIDLYPSEHEFETMKISRLLAKLDELVQKNQAKIILIGSSHGGLVAFHYALRNVEKITKLILLAPALDYLDVLENRYDLASWRKQNYLELHHDIFQTKLRWNWEYVPDLKQVLENSKPLEQVFSIPTLLIHGTNDDVIPVDHSYSFVERNKHMDITLRAIEGGNHSLSNVLDEITAMIFSWTEKKDAPAR